MEESALSPLAEQLTKMPIEAVDEAFLGKLDIASLEEFLGYLSILGSTLRARAEWAAKWLDFKQRAFDKAKRLRLLPVDEAAAILASLAPEEAAEVKNAIENWSPPLAEKPATQSLEGSFISSDAIAHPGA